MKALAITLYLSDWFNLNLAEKKIFSNLLMQLQLKPNKQAYGLFEFNLETYGKVKLN